MSKETDKDTRTPEQVERDEFNAGWDDAGENIDKDLDEYEVPGADAFDEGERDEGAENDPPAEDEDEGERSEQDAGAEGDGEQDDTDPDGATRASEDGTPGVESPGAGDGSEPAGKADSEEIEALKAQLAKAQKDHNDALSEVGRLKGWQKDAEEKAAKAQSEAAAEDAKKRKAELTAKVEAALAKWGDDADQVGAEQLGPVLRDLVDSIAAPVAPPVESGERFTAEQVRKMVAEQVEAQAAVARDTAYADAQLGGDWWKATAQAGTAEAKKFDAWLAKQAPVLQTAADSSDVRDYVHVMQLYRDAHGIAKPDAKDDKSDAKDTKGDGVEDEVAKARETRKAGAKSAKASTGDVRGGTREARDDDGDFDAGWDAAGKDHSSEHDAGNYAWAGKDAKRVYR